MGIQVPPFKDPQLLKFAQQIVKLGVGGTTTGGGTTVGSGKPVKRSSDTQGATYWNQTDNNYWIFDQGQWTMLDTGLTVNRVTGQITTYTGELHSWLYRYIHIKYADSNNGMMGFSDYPTGKSYYGIRNTDDSTESTDPTDYIWSDADLPNNVFGPMVFFWYETQGGRQWKQFVGNTQPEGNFTTAPVNAIDLDIITTALGPVSITDPVVLVRYSNSIDGLTDFGSDPTNKQFIGTKGQADNTPDENPANYTWKPLPAVVQPGQQVFTATGQNGSLSFEVGYAPSDDTKYSTLGIGGSTNPTISPGSRSGYLVTKIVQASGSGSIALGGGGEGGQGTGSVSLGFPFVGQQGTYDTRTYPFLTIDQYGRVINISDLPNAEQFFVGSYVALYAGTNTVSLNHIVGSILVFLNGILLGPSDYTETTTTVTIPTWSTGEYLQIFRYKKLEMGTDNPGFTRVDTVLPSPSSSFISPFDQGTEQLYINGVSVPDSDYTYSIQGADLYLVLLNGGVAQTGSTITVISYEKVYTIPKFNKGATISVVNGTSYRFTNPPRPVPNAGAAANYYLLFDINGVLFVENTDYSVPINSGVFTLTAPTPQAGSPLEYAVFISDGPYV